LSLANRIDFSLTNSLAIKKLRLTDIVLDELNEIECENQNEKLAADFSIMSNELASVYNKLNSLFTDL